MQQALEACIRNQPAKAQEILEQALEQPEQEPVADVFEAKKTAFADCKQKVKAPDDVWTVSDGINFFGFFSHGWEYAKKYYTAPQPDINLNCPSVQKRLATSWGYVKAGPAAADHLAASGKAMPDPVAIVHVKKLKFHDVHINNHEWIEWLQPKHDGMKLYAGPLRVNDLTDRELADVIHGKGVPLGLWPDHIREYRLVIDADRLKNNITTPPCWCHKCNEDRFVNGIPYNLTRMILCPECGNKRCPHAADHGLACTNSNDPGQPGSAY